jgi:hypothetical protein
MIFRLRRYRWGSCWRCGESRRTRRGRRSVASAGLTPVYDDKNYPDFMKGVAGPFPAI